jgi:hypothetical protein
VLDRAQQLMIADKTITGNAALQKAQQDFNASQNVLDRAQQTSIATAQIEANKSLETSRQNAQTALATLQAGFDKAKIPAAFGADLNRTTMASVDSILADGTLDQAAKQVALQNVIDYANHQVDWANSFYTATIPQLSGVSTVTGGGGTDTVTAGGGTDTVTGGGAVDADGNPIGFKKVGR